MRETLRNPPAAWLWPQPRFLVATNRNDGCFQKKTGKKPKMDGGNNGTPFFLMDDFWGETPLFSETSNPDRFTDIPDLFAVSVMEKSQISLNQPQSDQTRLRSVPRRPRACILGRSSKSWWNAS